MVLQASSGFSTNSVFWIRSLHESEMGPSQRILEDIEPFFGSLQLPFQIRDVKEPAHLYVALESMVASHIKPILQLDMHGTKDGLRFVGSQEIARWKDVVPRLRAINVASGGNLCVVAGVCYAFFAIMQATIMDASPVNILIAPDKEVTTGKLEDGLAGFYRTLFTGREINVAFQHLGEPFKLFHAERFFVIAVCKYIRNACRGKGVDERRERLLSEVLLAGHARTSENMRRIRKQIKEGIKPDQEMMDRYAHRFLLGRACPFKIDELIAAVERTLR
jgi:hypothetical protein